LSQTSPSRLSKSGNRPVCIISSLIVAVQRCRQWIGHTCPSAKNTTKQKRLRPEQADGANWPNISLPSISYDDVANRKRLRPPHIPPQGHSPEGRRIEPPRRPPLKNKRGPPRTRPSGTVRLAGGAQGAPVDLHLAVSRPVISPRRISACRLSNSTINDISAHGLPQSRPQSLVIVDQIGSRLAQGRTATCV
jgi:hypothetical protein